MDLTTNIEFANEYGIPETRVTLLGRTIHRQPYKLLAFMLVAILSPFVFTAGIIFWTIVGLIMLPVSLVRLIMYGVRRIWMM